MLCITSAIPDEIRRLVELTAASPKGENRWIDDSRNLLFATLGIGYLESSVQLNQLVTDYPAIKHVVFTGSAGVYPNSTEIRIGDLCNSIDTILCDGAAELGLSAYIPIADYGPIEAATTIDQSLPSVRVATVISITTDDTLAAAMATKKVAAAENMELFGIARICREKSIPWNACLGITNEVGSKGRSQWLENHKKVADHCCTHIFDLIRRRVLCSR